MGEVTRRRFLANTSLGLGVAVTGIAAVTGLEGIANRGAAKGSGKVALPEPVILHIRDVNKGEVMILAGTTEVVIQDRELVAHLVNAVGRAADKGRR
jgi:hypothetical protein